MPGGGGWAVLELTGALPFDRQQYAASQFCHLLLTGKSGQFSEEPRKETLTGQTLHRSRAL